MRKALIMGGVLMGLLAGCGAPDAGMGRMASASMAADSAGSPTTGPQHILYGAIVTAKVLESTVGTGQPPTWCRPCPGTPTPAASRSS